MSDWTYIGIGIAVGIALVPIGLWLAFKLLVWALKRKFMGMFDGLGMGGAPPLEISLRSLNEDPGWLEDSRARTAHAELLSLGFSVAGDFEVTELDEVFVRAYASCDHQTAAYLFRHPAKDGPVLDIVRLFSDDTSLCLSNGDEDGLEQCPQHLNIKQPGAAPRRLLEKLEAKSEGRTAQPILPSQAAEVYEQGYARLMAWRVERGGVTESEIRAQASGKITDEELALAKEQLRSQNLMQLQELLGNRYKKQSDLSVSRWEEVRYRLLYAHDLYTPSEIQQALSNEYLPWRDIPTPTTGGRAGFRELLEKLDDHGLEHIGEVSGTTPADVYVLPEPPDDDC